MGLTNLPQKDRVKVILFSGGRGSEVLSKELLRNPRISLTVAINGYDDGASTGEVRKFFGDSLGPSDFRKNASRLATELQCCNAALISVLDLRLPGGCSVSDALATLQFQDPSAFPDSEFHRKLKSLIGQIERPILEPVTGRLERFKDELVQTKRTFNFSDCSLGNLVFAGCYIEMRRNFNAAVDDYCSLLQLPRGMIENVTDGANAYLVALDHQGNFLASEADIVDANRRNRIKDIFLIDHPIICDEMKMLQSGTPESQKAFLERRSVVPHANPRLLQSIQEADLIIYSPGTQHSSLFPSYLTAGLGASIATNLSAIKLLVTNVQEDAEIHDTSAVEIIEKAVRYLKEKDKQRIPTPCLITHYLMNDPGRIQPPVPYVPLGRLETLEDPRMVRIGNYADRVTSRHNAAKVVTPFIESILRKDETRTIAVLLLESSSLNIISQTLLEMLRAGVDRLPLSISVYYCSKESFDEAFVKSLPFHVQNCHTPDRTPEDSFLQALHQKPVEYVILFESSGMYRGDEIVNVASLLNSQRLDAVWGSRRLSIRDIHESYRVRYRHNILIGAVSYLGSHLLSFLYLLLYGRYISDTLSGVRAIRPHFLTDHAIDLKHHYFNQQILSIVLRNRGNIFETPIQFFPISPEKVRRTTIFDGLTSVLTVLRWRMKRLEKAVNTHLHDFENQREPATGTKNV